MTNYIMATGLNTAENLIKANDAGNKFCAYKLTK